MRNIIASSVSVFVFSTTLIFLVQMPRETTSLEPITMAKGAVTVLTPFVKSYLSDLNAKKEAEKIKIRVWMHKGDPKLNGCGFYVQVKGFAGGFASGRFPSDEVHFCGEDKYEMRMTSQSAMYDETIRLGNEQAREVQVHADGWHNTYVNVMCVGFNERTIAGGPRAFCINNDILKSCKELMNKWNDIEFNWNDITLTRTTRAAHKIIFRDIETLISGYERLDRDLNDVDAIWTICDRIDLVKGTDNYDNWTCSATIHWIEASGFFDYAGAWLSRSRKENKNPYGCQRYTNRK